MPDGGKITIWDGRHLPRLGVGTWPLAGPFYAGTTQLGYAPIDRSAAIDLLRHAVDSGLRFFDTAAVYGAGNAESLVGEAIDNRADVVVATKFGPTFDEATRQVTGTSLDADFPTKDVEQSLRRLRRDRIDLYQLHVNTAPTHEAQRIFDTLDELVQRGKIAAYGWSTDFPDRIVPVAGRQHFAAVQYAMNVFFDAPTIRKVAEQHDLISIARSPLAMGVLGGGIGAETRLPAHDIRSNNFDWMDYFKDGAVPVEVAGRLERVRELLTTGGRTLAQGALAWLWAKSPRILPIPGARSIRHMDDNLKGLELGPLPQSTVSEIEALIDRPPEGEARER